MSAQPEIAHQTVHDPGAGHVGLDRDRRVRDWLQTPGGAALVAAERAILRQVLPRLFGPCAVQIGPGGGVDLLEASTAATRVLMGPAVQTIGSDTAGIRATPEALPLATESVSLLLLVHVLEFSPDPHRVLREADRVLVPEGRLVIAGFNPYSLWGLRRAVARGGPGAFPWDGQFEGGHMCHYRPPTRRHRLHQRLRFLEPSGNRWWPLLAASYVLVARKRTVGYTVVPPRRWLRRQFRPAMIRTTTWRQDGNG